MTHQAPDSAKPAIGILGWEDMNNTNIYGSLAAPGTFPFPVRFTPVDGACFETVIAHPDKKVLENMIHTARTMEKSGAKAITTSCGFNAIFQHDLSAAVAIPVFTSTLILIPLISNMLHSQPKIGVITADRTQLTREHLQKAGVPDRVPVCISGIEETAAYTHICKTLQPERLDVNGFRNDIITIAGTMAAENPDLGAIILECTVLHVFANDIKKTTGLPVFDIVGLINYIYNCITFTPVS